MGTSGGTPLSVRVLDHSRATDHNLIAWTAPMTVSRDTALLSTEAGAGIMKLTRVRRVPVSSVTNILIYITTGGSALSDCRAALYTAAGALVGQSGDVSTSWQSIGVKTMALTGGPFALAEGDYYVGLWYNGTTAPTVLRAGQGHSSSQINVGQTSVQHDAAYADTGLTTTAPATIGAKTASSAYWWAGLS